MGITQKKLIVKKSFDAEQNAEVDFIIDSGAVFSLVPSNILGLLGIKPYKKMTFTLGDGTHVDRQITLESLGLVLNPFTRELYPMRMLLV